MQKAPVIKGSGLKPLNLENKPNEEVHVFGKNLEERVVAESEVESAPITFESPQNQEGDDIEAIRERKFEALTGEEDEDTVFQGEFKLFIWDQTTSNWIEKGRGQLKINDPFDVRRKSSRLIMRVGGTLRIILNVAIRPPFRIITSSKTNLRFTDGQKVWAASGSNADFLKELIEQRAKKAAEYEETKKRTHHDEDDFDYDAGQANNDDSVDCKKKKCDDDSGDDLTREDVKEQEEKKRKDVKEEKDEEKKEDVNEDKNEELDEGRGNARDGGKTDEEDEENSDDKDERRSSDEDERGRDDEDEERSSGDEKIMKNQNDSQPSRTRKTSK